MTDVTHALPAHLLAAYRITCYRVPTPSAHLTLKVDRHDPDLAKLMREAKVQTAALLTAWNPGSNMQTREANQAGQAELERELHDAGIVCLRGRNEAPVDSSTLADWSEDSVLALGISLEAASALAVRHGQAAFLWMDREATPRLMVTATSGA